jgi:hypothetical protein
MADEAVVPGGGGPHDWERFYRTRGVSMWRCRSCGWTSHAGELEVPPLSVRMRPRNYFSGPAEHSLSTRVDLVVDERGGLTCDELSVLRVMEG